MLEAELVVVERDGDRALVGGSSRGRDGRLGTGRGNRAWVLRVDGDLPVGASDRSMNLFVGWWLVCREFGEVVLL